MYRIPLFTLALLSTACDSTDDSGPAVVEPPGALDVDVTILDFGTLGVGESESHAVTLSNLGQGDLTVWDVRFQNDTVRAHWSIDDPSSGTLEPGGTRAITVSFAPRAIGELPADLVILSDDPDAPERSVSLLGECWGTPQIGLSKTTLDFGEVEIGTSDEQDLWFSNWGNGDLTLIDVVLGNPDDPTFSLLVDPTGTVLAPGAENGLAVLRFTPIYNGSWYGSLFIESDDPVTPEIQVTLVGRGITP